MTRDGLIYPAPTLVVGVGRFGLATLERLAEDWQRLKLSSDDPSIKNLRLIHVRPQRDTPPEAWRKSERQFVDLARYTGDGDLPSLALDFLILRSLGLIRYRDGAYQVAVPRDAGLVEKGVNARVVRRRYFEWLPLHPDPIAAIERLELLCDREVALGLFVRPIVSRIRQGHSPRALLRCVSRVRAYAEGRDPSPWSWFRNLSATQREREPIQDGHQRLPFAPTWLSQDDLRGLLEGFAPEPMSGWHTWFKRIHHDWVHEPEALEHASHHYLAFDVTLPELFAPRPHDLPSPIEPEALLRVDWETNGWATDLKNPLGEVEFLPVLASPFRLGLFDHDDSSRVHVRSRQTFAARLEELGLHAHRGLVRLWVDLQRGKVEDRRNDPLDSKRKDGVDDALRQTLEILGELVVRPLIDESQVSQPQSVFPEARDSAGFEEPELPEEPTDFLRELELERRGEHNQVRSALTRRLLELGFDPQQADLAIRPLFHQVEISPDELSSLDIHGPQPVKLGADHQPHGLLAFRHVLNQETRHLFEFGFLSRYRHRPTRRPPRLTVYVVGDVTEPFVRTSMRALLRELHAELLRAYSPIFETFREGFDRSLSVLPILWMPHPADAFGGLHPLENRCEEAAIIEAVQGVRRWVETVPHGTRCIPQVIINSRVTDNAILSQRDAVRQTRDFMTFQIRNDLSRDAWLRRTVVGPPGDDFFASFSCHEIEFPAERAREYLANKLARDMIHQIKQGEPAELPTIEEEPLAPPPIEGLLKEPTARTRRQTRRAAEGIGELVEHRVQLSPQTSVEQLQQGFDEAFERDLYRQIHQQWRSLTRDRGEMDAMMDALRRNTSTALGKTLGLVHATGDELVDLHASRGGLKAAQAGFTQIEQITRELLMGAEDQRQRSEEICRKHRIPQTDPVGSARQALVTLSEEKPDHLAMRAGLFFWALIVPGLGAPLCYTVARFARLHQSPGFGDFMLGTLAPLLGGLLLFLPVWFLTRRHMERIVTRIREAIQELAQRSREVVEGTGSAFGGTPSIRSFIEARLHMTASLSARNFALRVHENVVQDTQLAHRLSRSIDIQQDTLTRRAEDLGVRAQMAQRLDAESDQDDVSQLFSTRDGQLLDFLVRPVQLLHYYDRRYGDVRERQTMVPHFIEQVGGFSSWRKQACLSDTERILRHTRTHFEEIVARPVAEQYDFEKDVGESLLQFVQSHYSNMGFGAKFIGYEGLDPDGVQVLCQAALVMHPALRSVFEEARRKPGARPFTETLDVMETAIIPNAAYMLSFAQGIRPHSVRNLRRFESYHDRVNIPDEHAFPVSGEPESHLTLNRISGFDDLRDELNYRVLELSRNRGHLPPLREADAPAQVTPPPSASRAIADASPLQEDEDGVGLVDLRDFVPLDELRPDQRGASQEDR